MAKQRTPRRDKLSGAPTAQKHKFNPKPKVDTASPPSAPRRRRLSPRIVAWTLMIGFGVVAYVMLVVCYSTYMRKVEGLSLFLGTQMFFDECMAVPGGLVAWLSCLLVQALYIPPLGALVVVLLSVLVQWMAIRAYRVPWTLAPLTVILPVLTLSAFVNLGYLVFTLRPAGHALSLPIGLIFALCIFWLYRLSSRLWLRLIIIAATVALGYWLLGFYALLAAGMCGCYRAFCPSAGRGRFLTLAVAAVLVAAVPRLWFVFVGGNLMESLTYLSGLPYFYADEWGWWLLYGCVFALLICASLLSGVNMRLRPKPYAVYGAWAAMVALMVVCRYSDPDFMLTLELDRAIWDQDWQRATAIAESHRGPTTRLNTVLAYVPLLRTAQAADRMFAMPYGSEPYCTSRGTRPLHDAAGALVAYHLGLINYATRWAMEYTIGQSQGVERLKILAKCALLNYELPLAETYLDILYNTPMHRAWAQKYMRYVHHPLEMSADAELSAIRQLMCQESRFINDGGAYESYIWPLLAHSPMATPQFDDLSMQAALITRDLDAFVQKLTASGAPPHPLGRHYQEAALLWSVLGDKPLPVNIDQRIIDGHQRFLNQFRATTSLGAERQREALRADFGDTYWFYYIFTEDMGMI